MAIEIVDFPMKNGWIFHSYVKLPEGIHVRRIDSSDFGRFQLLMFPEYSKWGCVIFKLPWLKSLKLD